MATPPPGRRHHSIAPAAILVGIALLASLTIRIADPDVGQHLVVGRTIWRDHAVRGIHLWSWPRYGARETTESWLFCVLLEPFWRVAGAAGLAVFRWVTALLAGVLLYRAARRAGAHPHVALVVITLASLVFRGRGAWRPESVAAILIAAELLMFEARRHGGADRGAWLVGLLLVWVNLHLSYLFGLWIAIAYLVADLGPWRGAPVRRRAGLPLALLAAVAALFVNPFGWRLVALPFQYLFVWRHELVYRSIGELGPLPWGAHLLDLLPVYVAAWLGFGAWNAWRRRAVDLAGLLIAGAAFVEALMSQRFVATFVLVAAVPLARDASDCLAPALRRWDALPWAARDAGAIVACLALGLPCWLLQGDDYGIGWHERSYPVAALDYVARHDVRGRGFNYFWTSGWQLLRFFPDRGRLPFMDVHQSGSREDRELHVLAQFDTASWARLDGKYRFDYVVIPPDDRRTLTLPSFIERDSSWALVFLDDCGAVYVRRAAFPALVPHRYTALRGSMFAMQRVVGAAARDTVLRRTLAAEAARSRAASPQSARADMLLGVLAAMDDRLDAARARLREAAAIDPAMRAVHEKLGQLALADGDTRAAEREFRAERRADPDYPDFEFRMGQTYRARGDRARAAAFYRKALERDPGAPGLEDSLRAVSGP